MYYVYKSLACLLLIPVQNFFQNQHLAEFQDPSIKRRAITNGIICRPRIRLESYLRSTAYFSFGPPSLVIVQTEINTPRSLGACSHLRNCIPTRHIVKLSFLSFSLPREWGGRRGWRGWKRNEKSLGRVQRARMNARRRGPLIPDLEKEREEKRGKKEKEEKGWSLERERERGRAHWNGARSDSEQRVAIKRNLFGPDEKFDSDRGGLFAIPIEFRDANQLKSRFNLPNGQIFLAPWNPYITLVRIDPCKYIGGPLRLQQEYPCMES